MQSIDVGKILNHRYRVIEQLGKGGQATVWRARDEEAGWDVALKVPIDADAVARLKQEAEALSALPHKHILRLLKSPLDLECGHLFLVLEYMAGGNLDKRLVGKPWALDRALEVLRQIAAVVDYAHRQNWILRDVKPRNILFVSPRNNFLARNKDELRVADFGLVRPLDQAQDDPGLTRGGPPLFTPAYAAPEQILGQSATAATDIYALGAIGYELLCGKRTFPDSSITDLTNKIAYQDPPAPRSVNRRLSVEIEQALQRVLAKEPSQRFTSAQEFIDALEAARLLLRRKAARHAYIGGGAVLLIGIGLGAALLAMAPSTVTVIPAPQVTSVAIATTRAASSTPLAVQVPPPPPTATSVPSNTPTPRATSVPSNTPTPTADQAWTELRPVLDELWGKNWPELILVLELFQRAHPDQQPSLTKLYDVYVEAAKSVASVDVTQALEWLDKAQLLDPQRGEAPALSGNLRATPTPTLTPPTATLAIRPPTQTPRVLATATPTPPKPVFVTPTPPKPPFVTPTPRP